jgi:NADH dehydrogenase FAD-containing subunit
MTHKNTEPDFGATGQFGVTGIFQSPQAIQETDIFNVLGTEKTKSMVLVGTGAGHKRVLIELMRHQRKDVDAVLVAAETTFIHPHLMMSWVAGDLPLDRCSIDLRSCAIKGGVRWIAGSCVRIDPHRQQIEVKPVPTDFESTLGPQDICITYDVLSLDDDCAPESCHFEDRWPGATEYAVVIQPSTAFVQTWNSRLDGWRKYAPYVVQQVCVLGNHRHAIEWAFAVQQGLQKAGITAQVTLITGGDRLGQALSPALFKRVMPLLAQRGIKIKEDRCVQMNADTLKLEQGGELPCDLPLIYQGLPGHPAIAGTPVLHDPHGRVYINPKLQSVSHPALFALGGVSDLENDPHIMSGWDHERIPDTLSLNLMAYLSEQPLSNGHDRSRKPIMLHCSDQTTLVQWGPVCTESHWVWKMYQKQQQSLLFQHKDQ